MAQRRTLLYAARSAGDRGRVAPTLQHATPASCAGVSATRPRDPHLRAGQVVGVKELEQWPNNWGQVRVFEGFGLYCKSHLPRAHFASRAPPHRVYV